MQFYFVLPPRQSEIQVSVSLVSYIVPAPHQIGECAPSECVMRFPAHVFDSTGKNQVCCFYYVVLSQEDVHVRGCDAFGLFSRGLTHGLFQAVGWLGTVRQRHEGLWLVATFPQCIAIPCDRSDHIDSRAWGDFRTQCLARRSQFLHVLAAGRSYLFRHTPGRIVLE